MDSDASLEKPTNPVLLLDEVKQLMQKNWPVFLGLILMYVPTVYTLSNTVWSHSDQAHGPLILFVVMYLFWIKRDEMTVSSVNSSKMVGWIILSVGLIVYAVGHSQDMIAFDVGSSLLVIIGILLIKGGATALKRFWFPVFFLFFMVPLPGSLLDVITVPMKISVSYVAEHILYWFGFPVARSGVIIQIGQYKLFVADACAGMHTLISLEALGLFYLSVVQHASALRNILLGLLIIPISFISNVIRVIVLILVTYYLGDAAAQGFIHGFASVLLFMVALVLIIVIDTSIQKMIKHFSLDENNGA